MTDQQINQHIANSRQRDPDKSTEDPLPWLIRCLRGKQENDQERDEATEIPKKSTK